MALVIDMFSGTFHGEDKVSYTPAYKALFRRMMIDELKNLALETRSNVNLNSITWISSRMWDSGQFAYFEVEANANVKIGGQLGNLLMKLSWKGSGNYTSGSGNRKSRFVGYEYDVNTNPTYFEYNVAYKIRLFKIEPTELWGF